MLATPDIAFPALEKIFAGLGLSIAEISHIGPVRQHTDYSKYPSQLGPIFCILALSTKSLPVACFQNFLIEEQSTSGLLKIGGDICSKIRLGGPIKPYG
jgi:hypothetical protein